MSAQDLNVREAEGARMISRFLHCLGEDARVAWVWLALDRFQEACRYHNLQFATCLVNQSVIHDCQYSVFWRRAT